MAPLMAVSGSAGSPVENWVNAPASLLPGTGPLRADESKKQAALIPAAAFCMARCASLVLAR